MFNCGCYAAAFKNNRQCRSNKNILVSSGDIMLYTSGNSLTKPDCFHLCKTSGFATIPMAGQCISYPVMCHDKNAYWNMTSQVDREIGTIKQETNSHNVTMVILASH